VYPDTDQTGLEAPKVPASLYRHGIEDQGTALFPTLIPLGVTLSAIVTFCRSLEPEIGVEGS